VSAAEGATLAQTMSGLAARGEAVALRWEGGQITYGELSRRADLLASALLGLGLAPGERFAFLLPNGPRIIECYLACARSGIVAVPLSDRATVAELTHQVTDSGARTLLYADSCADKIAELPAAGVELDRLIAADPTAGVEDYEALLAGGSGVVDAPAPTPDDLFSVMYTGGTTGVSKAAEQTQRSWAAAVRSVAEAWSLGEGDRHLAVLPMDHVSWFSTASILIVGGEVWIEPSWDPERVLAIVEREAITTLNMIPTMFGDFLEVLARAERPRLDSIRLVTVAGSPMPVEMYQRGEALLGPVMGCIYGMTESSGPVTFLLPEDLSVERLRSGGKPGRGIELTILDEEGNPTDGAEPGEIGLRGPQMTRGYLNRPEASAEAFRDGWFLSGDIGRIDADGFLYIVDRSKDMIKSGGFNVYPKEVEDVLYATGEVLEVAVIGLPDPRWIEAVHAVVVLRPGSEIDAEELRAYCRERLPGYKVPKAIHFEQVLPRTKVGKFDKRELRRRYA
jgi:acyl-CoA synthetase (AMP-forming)/AMP-acid ligase II